MPRWASRVRRNSRLLRGAKTESIIIDPSVVRSLEYYTGPVYELNFCWRRRTRKAPRFAFGSVAAADATTASVALRGEPVPATGFSIGVSRLQAALTLIGKLDSKPAPGPVVVTVFGGDIAHYQKLVAMLRTPASAPRCISAIRAQSRPADEIARPPPFALRDHPRVERARKGEVQIKDLILGAGLTASRTATNT